MTSIAATALRQDLYRTIARVNDESRPIAITTSKGKGAVLIGEDDWAAIEETLYLTGIPGMTETLTDSLATDPADCVPAREFDW